MLKRELVVDKVVETAEGGKITSYRQETFKEAWRRNNMDIRRKVCDLKCDHPVFFAVTSWCALFGGSMVAACFGAAIFGNDKEDDNTEE